ncbi:MAG: hypothetical protein PHE25_06500, partial [Candidatus Gracilibacteria bacterium]|nr:hypothetical protein [Candidatus Gracilibacteria bacterium]
IKFWDKYGKQLARALNMLDGQDRNERYEKTDKIILLEAIKGDEGNPILKEYYNHIKGWMGEIHFKEDVPEFHEVGLSGINTFEVCKQALEVHSGRSFRHKDLGSKVWEKIVDEVDHVKNRKYSEGEALNRKYQEAVLKEKLRGVIAAIVEVNHGSIDQIQSSGVLGYELNRWGINLRRDFDTAPRKILEGATDDKLNPIVEGILSGNSGAVFGTGEIFDLRKVREGFGKKVDTTVKSANDEDNH